MEEILLKIVEELNSSVFVLVLILAAAFQFTYKVGSWKQIFDNHKDRIDNIEKISDTVKELKVKVDLIYQYTVVDKCNIQN